MNKIALGKNKNTNHSKMGEGMRAVNPVMSNISFIYLGIIICNEQKKNKTRL